MKRLSLIYKILIVIVSGISLFLNFSFFGDFSGVFYYTILSNIYCFVFYFISVLLFDKLKINSLYHKLRGFGLLSIVITMFVFNFFLLPTGNIDDYVGHMFEANMLHTVVPVLVILENVLFERKGNFRYRYLIDWGLMFVLYGMFIICYSLLGGRFLDGNVVPYPFLDVGTFGIGKCFILCLFIMFIYFLIGYLIIMLDKLFYKEEIKK